MEKSKEEVQANRVGESSPTGVGTPAMAAESPPGTPRFGDGDNDEPMTELDEKRHNNDEGPYIDIPDVTMESDDEQEKQVFDTGGDDQD